MMVRMEHEYVPFSVRAAHYNYHCGRCRKPYGVCGCQRPKWEGRPYRVNGRNGFDWMYEHKWLDVSVALLCMAVAAAIVLVVLFAIGSAIVEVAR